MQTTMSKQRAAAAKSASGKIEREWGKTQRCSSASAAEKENRQGHWLKAEL